MIRTLDLRVAVDPHSDIDPAPDITAALDTDPVRDPRYRWWSHGHGTAPSTTLSYDPGSLAAPAVREWAGSAGHPAGWEMRLRPATGGTPITCALTRLGALHGADRDSVLDSIAGHITAHGEGAALVVFGDFTTGDTDRLAARVPLRPAGPGDNRVLVTDAITVTAHDPHRGTADLRVRSRRDMIKDRTWTQVGAEVVRRRWWYQPERASRVRCESHAEAQRKLHDDPMGGGTIALEYVVQNPDGRRIEARTSGTSSTAGVRRGDRVLGCRFLVVEDRGTRTTRFETAAEALRSAWAWGAEYVAEELTIGRDGGAAVTVPGDKVRLHDA
ncbi:hypothetical protein CLV63_12194 [Murinocardiopsis flavida]|uniref:Uncharacterized protein n=2 Tax=Murinocardiopsis flavida TaxID=645275 RepID=A0A2P8D169_9ACTN|nr:hypothetical protein CLV63_12194 [Murinocardiopsis flavida]